MDRRSRSTTRNRNNGEPLSLRDQRNTNMGRSFPEIPINSSLINRMGGDSRTLSPERKHYGFPKTSPHHSMNKSGSYNVYTQGAPPPIPPPSLNHASSTIGLINGNGGHAPNGNPVPPPRAPVSSSSGTTQIQMRPKNSSASNNFNSGPVRKCYFKIVRVPYHLYIKILAPRVEISSLHSSRTPPMLEIDQFFIREKIIYVT